MDELNGTVMVKSGNNGYPVSSPTIGFAGMYEAGYEAGYAAGKESEFRKGSDRSHLESTISQQGRPPVAAAEVTTAAKHVPQRTLLGMPCTKCGIYLYKEESHCPRCNLPCKIRELKVAA